MEDRENQHPRLAKAYISPKTSAPLAALPVRPGSGEPIGPGSSASLQSCAYEIVVLALAAEDLDYLLPELVARVGHTLHAEYCEVLELLEDKILLLRAGAGFRVGAVGRERVGVNLESQAGYTLLRRRPVVVEDVSEERRFDADPLLIEHGVVSGVSVPICAGEMGPGEKRCFGVLGVHNRSRRRFTNEEVHFLAEAGRILGAAYDRHAREKKRQEELSKVRTQVAQLEAGRDFDVELLEVLSTASDEEAVAVRAAEMAVPVLADWCFVDLLDGANGASRIKRLAVGSPDCSPESTKLVDQLVGHYPINLRGQHGTPKVLRTRRSELIRDVDDRLLQSIARDETGLKLLRRLQPRSYLGVPLYSESNLGGVLVLLRDGASNTRYGQADLELAERYAAALSLALGSVTNGCDHFEHRVNGQEREIIPADPDEDLLLLLSPRQREVFEHLAELKSNQEIGDTLFVSVNTVKSHIFRSRQVFGLDDRPALVKKARALLKGD